MNIQEALASLQREHQSTVLLSWDHADYGQHTPGGCDCRTGVLIDYIVRAEYERNRIAEPPTPVEIEEPICKGSCRNMPAGYSCPFCNRRSRGSNPEYDRGPICNECKSYCMTDGECFQNKVRTLKIAKLSRR